MIYRLLLFFLLLLMGCQAGAASTATPIPSATAAIPNLAAATTPWVRAPQISTSAPPPAPAASPTAPPGVTTTPTPTATLAPPTAVPTAPPTPVPPTPVPPPAPPVPAYGYPIGRPGRLPGAGFFVRHGYQVENTWFNPGYWHTGEDWYAREGDTAGAQVYAIAAGTVVYVGANYPGRVVIVEQDDGLFSMYGHLDPAVAVQVDQRVRRGDLLGTILRRSDDVPNHLHFEVRTFLTSREVNGAAPRYGFRCGVQCPPGPGYWPIGAPDLPSDMGWRNPTHVINNRMFPPDAGAPLAEVQVVAQPVAQAVTLWSAPPGAEQTATGELPLQPEARFPLLAVWTGPENSRGTSAEAYQLWYRIGLPDGGSGWVPALVASDFETGGDGRPATLFFHFVPVMGAAGSEPGA